MKIAVIAANGQAGQKIVAEALARGFDVTAIARSENKSAAKNFVKKDIMELTREDLAGFDAVVDAFGMFDPVRVDEHTTTSQHLADILSGTNTRLLIVGGAGSLYVDEKKETMLSETPDFPPEYLPVAKAMARALKELRKRDDVRWTFVSPAADFQADGARTGNIVTAGEIFTVDANGESVISYVDYAIGIIDEIEKGNHIRERISLRQA